MGGGWHYKELFEKITEKIGCRGIFYEEV